VRALIAFVLALCAGPLAAAAVDPLERFYADTHTLAGRFTQTVRDANGTVTEESRGTFAIARPGHFRWDYEAPYAQTIVTDGRELWVYEPDLDQATVRPIDDQTADAPGLLLSGARFPSDLFDASADKDGWIKLTPRRKDSGLGSVRLLLAGGSVRTLELADGMGQTTRIEFADTQRNGEIAPARFHFTPPAGVDVIRGAPQSPAGAAR
jgi:outer membrane lipoprotein carrier protein